MSLCSIKRTNFYTEDGIFLRKKGKKEKNKNFFDFSVTKWLEFTFIYIGAQNVLQKNYF